MNTREFQEKLFDLISEGLDNEFIVSVQCSPDEQEDEIEVFLHDGTAFNVRIMPIMVVG